MHTNILDLILINNTSHSTTLPEKRRDPYNFPRNLSSYKANRIFFRNKIFIHTNRKKSDCCEPLKNLRNNVTVVGNGFLTFICKKNGIGNKLLPSRLTGASESKNKSFLFIFNGIKTARVCV